MRVAVGSRERPSVVVLAGPNGSGKTTVAPMLLNDLLDLPEFVNADQIAIGLSGFAPAGAAIAAGRVMLERIHSLAESGEDFAFETTLASLSFKRLLSRMREDHGYRIHIAFLWLPTVQQAISRVADRVRQGGHTVPVDVIRRRYIRCIRNFLQIYAPLADVWEVIDNSRRNEPHLIAIHSPDTGTAIIDHDRWAEFQGC